TAKARSSAPRRRTSLRQPRASPARTTTTRAGVPRTRSPCAGTTATPAAPAGLATSLLTVAIAKASEPSVGAAHGPVRSPPAAAGRARPPPRPPGATRCRHHAPPHALLGARGRRSTPGCRRLSTRPTTTHHQRGVYESLQYSGTATRPDGDRRLG